MREELGDQWIEIIDGQKHMVKAVAPIELCKGCFFNCNQGGCCWKGFDNCQMGSFFIIRDLGILNEDGLLPCPFCGEYPVVENAYEGCGYPPPDGYWRVYCSNDNHEISMSSGKCRQESIDAWNRRA